MIDTEKSKFWFISTSIIYLFLLQLFIFFFILFRWIKMWMNSHSVLTVHDSFLTVAKKYIHDALASRYPYTYNLSWLLNIKDFQHTEPRLTVLRDRFDITYFRNLDQGINIWLERIAAHVFVTSKRTHVKRFRNSNLSDSFSSAHQPSFPWPI